MRILVIPEEGIHLSFTVSHTFFVCHPELAKDLAKRRIYHRPEILRFAQNDK